MILIVENYFVPNEKIIKFLFPAYKFNKIQINSPLETFKFLHESVHDKKMNFIISDETVDSIFLNKIKYYFDQICTVNGSFLKYINKKRRFSRIYEIIRNEREIINFEEISENLIMNSCQINTGKTIKPYLDAQNDEEVIIYPSDEE